MAAAGRDDEGTLGEFLAANVGEIHVVGVKLGEQLVDARDDRLGRKLAGQDADRVGERADAVDGDRLDHGGLAGVARRQHQLRDAGLRRRHRHRQGALDRPNAAVEGQLAHRGEVFQLIGQQLSRCYQQRQRDRQVETAGVLAEIGRSEVDDGAAGMTGVTEIGQSTLDAMHALLDRHLWQADEDRFGQTRCGIDLGFDRNGVDAHEREGVQFGEHARAISKILGRGVEETNGSSLTRL